MNTELPQAWATTTLGEICSKPQYGWTCRGAKEGRVRYLRTTDISGGQINWSTVPFCEEAPDDIEKYRLHANDILVSRAGSVGVSYRIKDAPLDAIFASYLIRFNALEGIEAKFVEAFLKSKRYWEAISEFTAGIAIPNVNASKLASLELPLAPFAEQRRIVAKLGRLGLQEGELPHDKANINDLEICKYIVALTRTRKQCQLLHTWRYGGLPKRPSVFIDWIKSERRELVKVDKDYWEKPAEAK